MQFPPPIIGITTSSQHHTGSYCLPSTYVKAVRAAGGMPILLPPVQEELSTAIVQRLDGLIFSGGGDIDPAIYKGSCHPTIYNIDTERDRTEIALAIAALAGDIPILGICRGLEIMVVATGGSLTPHIPDEFGEVVIHRAEQALAIEHAVEISADSQLAKIVADTHVNVVSWHHQAARQVGCQWRVTAWAADGVIEAIEHQQHPWAIALQWHPELASNCGAQQRIFQAFIAATRTKTCNSDRFSQAFKD